MLIVIVGAARSKFPMNGVVAALLLPSIIFVVGVRHPWIVRVFGALLLGITGLSWGIFWLNRQSSTGGPNLMAGTVSTFLAALAAVCVQLGESAGPQRPGGADTESAPEAEGDAGTARPRAW